MMYIDDHVWCGVISVMSLCVCVMCKCYYLCDVYDVMCDDVLLMCYVLVDMNVYEWCYVEDIYIYMLYV